MDGKARMPEEKVKRT